jgi:hypothetical protein
VSRNDRGAAVAPSGGLTPAVAAAPWLRLGLRVVGGGGEYL